MFRCKICHIGLLSSLIFECVFTSREVFPKTYKNSQFIDSRIFDFPTKKTVALDRQASTYSFDGNTHPISTKYLGYLMPHLKYVNSHDGSNHESENDFYKDNTETFENSAFSSNKNAPFEKFSTNLSKKQAHENISQTTKNLIYEEMEGPQSSPKKKINHKVHKPYVLHKYPAKKTVFSNYVKRPLQKLKVFPKHKKKNKNPEKFTAFPSSFYDQQYINKKKKNHLYFGNLKSFNVISKNYKNDYENDEEDLTAGKRFDGILSTKQPLEAITATEYT